MRVRSQASALRGPGGILPTQRLSAQTCAVLVDRIGAKSVLTLEPALAPPPRGPIEAGPGFLKGPRLRLDVLPDGALTLVDRVDGVRWPLLATVRQRATLSVGSRHEGPLLGSVTVDSPGLRTRASLRAGEDRVRLRIEGGPPDLVRFPLGVEPTHLRLDWGAVPLAPGPYRHGGSVAVTGGMRDLAFLTRPGVVHVQRTRRQGFVLAFPLPPVFRCLVCRPSELTQAVEDRLLPVLQVGPRFPFAEVGNVPWWRVRRRGLHVVLAAGKGRELLVESPLP